MKRPTIDDVERLFQKHGDGLSTNDLLQWLTDDGFDIDTEYFWEVLAPQMMGRGAEPEVAAYIGPPKEPTKPTKH